MVSLECLVISIFEITKEVRNIYKPKSEFSLMCRKIAHDKRKLRHIGEIPGASNALADAVAKHESVIDETAIIMRFDNFANRLLDIDKLSYAVTDLSEMITNLLGFKHDNATSLLVRSPFTNDLFTMKVFAWEQSKSIYCWDQTPTGIFVVEFAEKITPQHIKDLEEALLLHSQGLVMCSGCGNTTQLKSNRRNLAGKYCRTCWEYTYKEKARHEST